MSRTEYTEEGTVSVNSVELYYKIMGEGEPVVVLHGGPGFDHIHMLPLGELARDYKIIFYDQRATGNSTGKVDANSITVDNKAEVGKGYEEPLYLQQCDEVFVDHSKDKITYAKALCTLENGKEVTIAFDAKAYLLNNNGKTVDTFIVK